jgi:hypothetical protein
MRPSVLTSHADRLVLSDGGGAATVLACEPALLAARHWPHTLPTPLQLERAIDDVEAAIEQAGLVQAPRGGLLLDETLSGLLAPVLDRGTTVSLDEVERAFSALVSAAQRGPGASTTDTLQGDRAAALLMLRELMHHLGFQSAHASG